MKYIFGVIALTFFTAFNVVVILFFIIWNLDLGTSKNDLNDLKGLWKLSFIKTIFTKTKTLAINILTD